MNILLSLLLSASAFALPGADAIWTNLSKKPTVADCTTADDQPWCRSTAVLHTDLAKIRETLSNMAEHVEDFESILELTKIDGDIMHVVMDFPTPLADRDYVARYTQTITEEGVVTITWSPESGDKAPATNGRVRLDKFAGSWTLKDNGDGTTHVVYLWQAEYGGSLPSFALGTARKKTAIEALKDLANAAGTTFTAP
ncbi:MAG: hypothetical protein GWP91_17575 [Rhodobacterales bacterium]|nr:hypothetical protein [Rhodobacterales bacterium]